MADDVVFVFNEPGMAHLTESWSGAFGTHIGMKAEQLEALGRGSAGFETGQLVASIDSSFDHSDTGALEARVGANPNGAGVGVALFNHEGTRPHEIRPVTARALKFRVGGIVVYAKRVYHPGTRATKFLSQWLTDLF